MDEEKKIMEKRSSFRGWKERNRGRIHQKRNIIVVAMIISIFSGLAIYPYLTKIDKDNSQPIGQLNKTPSLKPIKNIKVNGSNNSSSNVINISNVSKMVIVGNIGVPLISNGFEITVKSITPTDIRTNVWISVRNIEEKEKQFKIGPGTIIVDNIGQQYENIKVARSAEIAQTNLSAQAMREGAVFFESLKEGRSPKRLTLNINNQKVEFILDNR